jgi:hypothetical protein
LPDENSGEESMKVNFFVYNWHLLFLLFIVVLANSKASEYEELRIQLYSNLKHIRKEISRPPLEAKF